MPPDIKVLLNKPRREVVREGFRSFRYAPSIRIAQPAKSEDTEGGKTGGGAWIEADHPDIMRSAATGALVVKPSGLRDDFFDDSGGYSAGKIAPSDWRYSTPDWQIVPYDGYPGQSGSIKAFAQKYSSATDVLNGITVSGDLDDWRTESGTAMKWMFETNTALPMSSGFGVIIQPHGIAMQRQKGLMALAFGSRYVLEIEIGGSAKLWALIAGTWTHVRTFDYSQAISDNRSPFTVNVVPEGQSGITFYFSQSTTKTKSAATASGKAPRRDVSFHVDCREWFSTQYFAEQGITNAVPSAPLYVALWPKTFRTLWAAWRNVYPTTDVVFTCQPEQLIDPKEQGGLEVSAFGVFGTNDYPDGDSWLAVRALNTAGDGGWSSDDLIAPVEVRMRANLHHSPELWGYRMFIPDETEVPEWTPIDISDQWAKIAFTKSLDMDPAPARLRVHFDGDISDLMRLYGPVQIQVDDAPVWDGYCIQRRPVMEGNNDVWLIDQLECRSVHQRLSDTQAGFDSVAGVTVRVAIERLLQQCGFAQSDIEFNAGDSWMDTDTIGQPENADQDKLWSSDATVAEAIRTIFESYGVQGRSLAALTWRDGKWHIGSVADYDESSPPTKRFWMVPPVQADQTDWDDDDDRWADGQFKCLEHPEFTIDPPEFNAVRVEVAKSTSEESDGVAANIIGDSDSINDDESDHFTGRIITKTINAPKAMGITDQAEAERFARLLIDQLSDRLVVASWRGEWQPSIDIDDEVALIGRLPDPDIAGEFVTASLGAYRITEIAAEIEHDRDGKRHTWEAQYTAKYLGKAEYPAESITDYRGSL